MIHYKTEEEIKIMQEGGRRLRAVVKDLLPQVKAGMTTAKVNEIAEKLIKQAGGEISFNKVPGYDWATCLTINEQVVHTPPGKRVLKDKDVLTIDIGLYYQGFHTDFSTTFIIGGRSDKETDKFLSIGLETLKKAIDVAKAGNYLGQISETIEKNITGQGYFIMKALTGHGIGHELHEDPYVLGFLEKPVEKTLKIKPGLVIAIEIIYSRGSEKIAEEPGSDWSIISSDRSLTACFEHTVAITEKKTLILT
jgi:methionyl aminopeptidase